MWQTSQRSTECCDIHPTNFVWISSPHIIYNIIHYYTYIYIYTHIYIYVWMTCERICIVACAQMEVRIKSQRPYPAQTSGDDINLRNQNTTHRFCPKNCNSSVFARQQEKFFVCRPKASRIFKAHWGPYCSVVVPMIPALAHPGQSVIPGPCGIIPRSSSDSVTQWSQNWLCFT